MRRYAERPGAQSSIVARFFCVVDSWPGVLSCGVVFSSGPWLLHLCCVWKLCAMKRRSSLNFSKGHSRSQLKSPQNLESLMQCDDQQSCDSSSSKDTPRLIDVKGLGRPKEFSGKEEDISNSGRRRRTCDPGV